MTIELVPVKELFYNPENQYRVISCQPQPPWERPAWLELNRYNNFTISGQNIGMLALGVPVKLDIIPAANSKYEASYVVDAFAGVTFDERIRVAEDSEIMLMTQVMTYGQARNIHDAYPHFVEMILNGEDEQIDVSKIYNVGDYRFEDYKQKIKAQQSIIVFMSKTAKYNIIDYDLVNKFALFYPTPNVWEEAYTAHPYDVIYQVDKDMTFKRMDKLILGILPQFKESAERARYYIYDLLKQSETEGDTCLYASVVLEVLKSNYPELVKFVADVVKNDDKIHYDPKTKLCGLKATYDYEVNIANNILHRINTPYIDTMAWAQFKTVDGYTMTDEQNKLCELANNESICMLIGCAGSGKTTATRALIEMLDNYGKTYLLLAPTGIAAKRLRESTRRSASTIHMALAREDFDVPHDYIIIDEMSCVGVELLSLVFEHISKDTKVVFICDNAQLASISCGNIVQDIINSGVMPTANLTKIFRYGTSGIATVATNTRNGQETNREDSNFGDNDYQYIPLDEDNVYDQITEAYNGLIHKGYNRNDILILCPYNKSRIGALRINQHIQETYNDHTEGVEAHINSSDVPFIRFSVGDRVINIHNNYNANKAEIADNGDLVVVDSSGRVMNGDIGVIRHIDYITKDEETGEWVDYSIYVQFDETIICYEPKEIKNLRLGYCISIHKSQGSQAKAIITVISKKHKRLISRNLLYVAVSRAEEMLVEIVDKDCISSGLEIVETIDRTTWLGDLLACG